MYVCLCRAVTEKTVRALGRAGHVDEADLIDVMRLDDEACCGHCLRNIDAIAELAREGAGEGISGLGTAIPLTSG